MNAKNLADYLNELLECDSDAIQDLLKSRVICNEALASHSTCIVLAEEDVYEVGFLGVLNGLLLRNGDTVVRAVYTADDDETLLRFEAGAMPTECVGVV